MRRYRIIISRDRPDLLGTLAVAYGRRGEVEILFDRRRGEPWPGRGDRTDRRHEPHRQRVLHERGFLVLPGQPASARPVEPADRTSPQACRAVRRLCGDPARHSHAAPVAGPGLDCL